MYSPTKTSALVSCVLRYTPILIMASIYRDRLTGLSHVAGTGLRTHVDAGRKKGVSGLGVSLLLVPFFCSLPVFPRLSARVVLLLSPRCCFHACSIGLDVSAPLECTSANASAPMDLDDFFLMSLCRWSWICECGDLADHASCSH